MMDTTTTLEQKYTQEEFLDLALFAALKGRFQIAVWRKPNEKLIHILIDTTEKIKRVPIQLEDLPAGFILHPFADQEDKKAVFLEASELIKMNLDEDGFSSNHLPPWADPS